MAFQIVPNEDVSRFLRPSDVMAKTFLDGQDHDPHFIPPMGRIDAKKNLQIEMSTIGHEISQEDLPEPSGKEAVNVYLRVKPKTEDESKYYSITSNNTLDDEARSETSDHQAESEKVADTEVVSIESDHQMAFNAPPDSATYKNFQCKGKLTHRFSFTKILPSDTDQAGMFNEIVLPRLKSFLLEGRSQLIFSYGATSSGKTFTIQGDAGRPGILPRALDVLFNSFGDSYSPDVNYKPLGSNRLGVMVPREIERVAQEKKTIMEMDVSLEDGNLSTSSTSQQRVKDETKIELPHLQDSNYAIWISFAEIYNENIYDLFEKLPVSNKPGEKPQRRSPLKLADDKNGVYIKGLKEVAVANTDEAYQLLQIGRKNLKFAATRLNHHSSRSHCIFTIKVVKKRVNANFGQVNLLSFCDLAGSERIKKTLNTGERQKEAGNINTSLMVLGRVIKDLRHNQTVKNAKNERVVPYRDSKLTRLFQPFFKSGLGQVSMIVNISQSPYLFDETLHVLKFSAIASKVQIQYQDHDTFVAPLAATVKKKPQDKRKTRFSIMVEKNKSNQTQAAFRGSIAWENPQLCSTILHACPPPNKMAGAGHETSAVLEEEPEDLNETVVESTRYDVNGLLKLIDSLKNDLIEAKQKNIRIEAETRQELCEEFNKMMVEIETDWEKKLQEEKDRAAEYSDWRIGKLQEALDERRAMQRNNSNVIVETNSEELEQKIKELETAQCELDELKKLNCNVMDDNKELTKNVAGLKKTVEESRAKESGWQEQMNNLRRELESTKIALENETSDPRLKEMEVVIQSKEETIQDLKDKMEDMKSLLDEAAQDYHRLSTNVDTLQKEVAEKDFQMQELKGTESELRQLLTASNARNEEMELQAFEQAEQFEKLKLELDNVTQEKETTWSQKMGFEQQLTGLNDEVESLRSEKKKWRSLAESRESEISTLEKNIKTNLQSQMELTEKLSVAQKNLKLYEDKNSEKDTSISTLQKALNAVKKEESAIEALEKELNRKSEELSIKNMKIEGLQAKVAEQEYDVQRVKEDKEQLMNLYDQKLKKLTEELNLEKRETTRMRQLMHSNSTPQKDNSEVTKLREELKTKSEFIKTLAAKVTTPKKVVDPEVNLAEVEKRHEAELKKVKKAYEKLIEDYKKANEELLTHVPASAAKKVMSVKRTVEDSETEEVENTAPLDRSSIEATPVEVTNNGRKRRGRKTKGQSKVAEATTQVSFDDSTVCNDSVFEESKSKRPRRGERVSKARPQKQFKSCSSTGASEMEETQDTTTSILSDTSNIKVKNEDDSTASVASTWKTPATSKKRKLFSQTPRPDIITPQPDESDSNDTPRSIVKRQLRSRNIKIKK